MTCNCNKNPIKLGVKRLYKDVQLPQYAHVGDACFDIRVYIGDNESFFTDGSIPLVEDGEKSVPHKQIYIRPSESYTFHTGLVFDIPEGYMLVMYPRSGLGIKHHITLSNSTGIIDSCYTDELRVALFNEGKNGFLVNSGDRVAQGMLVPVPEVVIEEVDEVKVKSRGTDSGLGSSGVK